MQLPTLVTSALCIASVLAVVLGPACYSKGGSSLPLLLVAVYHALSHTVWALALSWLLFLYANGNLSKTGTLVVAVVVFFLLFLRVFFFPFYFFFSRNMYYMYKGKNIVGPEAVFMRRR